jgi:hypothetical protein
MEDITIIDPIKDPRWDKFVENHPHGWIVHLSGWKRLLEQSFPHMKGHYLALVDSTSNEIRAALPLFEVRSWLTGNRLVSIPFAQLCDPLVETSHDMEKILEGAFALSKELNTKFVEIRTYNAPSLKQNGHLRGDELYKHHFIPLDRDPETIRKSFHNRAINQAINRAVKHKLEIKIADSEAELKSFFELFTQTRKNLGVPYQPYNFFKILWDIFSPANMAILLLAKMEDRTASGILFFQFNGRFSAESEGWDREFSNTNPNHLIFWEAIKLAHKNGNKIFDFGITTPDNEGLVTFKNRWGTNVVDLHRYFYAEKPSKNFVESESSLKQRLIEGICKKSPDPIYKMFGNFCFRHMG